MPATIIDESHLPACPPEQSCTVWTDVAVQGADLLVVPTTNEWRFYRAAKDGEQCERIALLEGCWILVATSPRGGTSE